MPSFSPLIERSFWDVVIKEEYLWQADRPPITLNQWQPEDAVLRTDFNADNAKTDTALNNLEQLIGTKEAALLASISQCYGPKNPTLSSGSYKAPAPAAARKLPLPFMWGFDPLLLILDSTWDKDDEYVMLLGVPQPI